MTNYLILVPTIILIVYWIGAFFLSYHLLKYGITNWPKRLVTIFLLGSIFMSIISFMLFNQIDWAKTFNDTNGPNIMGSFNNATDIIQKVSDKI